MADVEVGVNFRFTGNRCGVSVDWLVDEAAGTLTVALQANANNGEYISFGFNTDDNGFHTRNRNQRFTDGFAAFINNGQGTVVDYQSESTSRGLAIDNTNNWDPVEIVNANGVLRAVVSRPLVTGDNNDFDVANGIVFAYITRADLDGNQPDRHGSGTYDEFAANLFNGEAIDGGEPAFELDPGYGLLLSVVGPLTLVALYKLVREFFKGQVREYRVKERPSPTNRIANSVARMSNRMSMALGRGSGPNMGRDQLTFHRNPAFTQDNQIQSLGRNGTINRNGGGAPAPRGFTGTIMRPNGQPAGNTLGRGFNRMSMALTQARERVVTANYSPKSVEESSFSRNFKTFSRRRVSGEITVFQTTLMFIYLALALAWVYLIDLDNPLFVEAANWGYVCCASALLVVIPATRNSVLTWFLFQPFERTIIYHRWLGRFTFGAGLAHTLYYIIEWQQLGVLEANLQVEKYQYGIYSMIGLFVVWATSIDYIRRRWYNMFRLFHYSFFVFFIAGVLHTDVFAIYAVIAGVLYGTDLFMRYALDLVPKEAYAVDILPGEVIRIRFPKNRYKSYPAGSYIFINIPKISLGEWHPFTLSSGPHQLYLEVHIKALGDFTTTLLNEGGKVATGEKKSFPKIRADGPYGRIAFNYNRYENVFLVGGGIGSTPMLSVLKHLYHIDVPDEERLKHPISPYVKNVFFLWVVPQTASWTWFFDVLRKCMETSVKGAEQGYPKLRIKGYVTKPDTRLPELQHAIKAVPNYSVTGGRPNVEQILTGVEASIGPGKKRIAALACGPTRLVSDIWDGCIRHTRDGVTFDCHREEFDF